MDSNNSHELTTRLRRVEKKIDKLLAHFHVALDEDKSTKQKRIDNAMHKLIPAKRVGLDDEFVA
jgi:hypothetical protein